MTDLSIKAIKTIAGGIYHALLLFGHTELSGRDWELLCSHLQISTDSIHPVSLIANGFTLTTKEISFKYLHNGFSWEKRVIEVTNLEQSQSLF